jgi:hypothetical protein
MALSRFSASFRYNLFQFKYATIITTNTFSDAMLVAEWGWIFSVFVDSVDVQNIERLDRLTENKLCFSYLTSESMADFGLWLLKM